MKAPDYWKAHYTTTEDPAKIERDLQFRRFRSAGTEHELLCFTRPGLGRNILISQGTAGHPFVFAELAHLMHREGYNVFVMPRHGGTTINALVERHRDALGRIADEFGPDTSAYGEGLGGYAVFYLALAGVRLSAIACENSPAVLTEPAYQRALLSDAGPWERAARRRRLLVPAATRLARRAPWLPVPISSYLPWKDLIDQRPGSRDTERRLVLDGYLHDPDFDRWYPLGAVASLLDTPPPRPLKDLAVPTLFILASDGPTPAYIEDLHARLPDTVPKRLVQVEGSVYWMLSHPAAAAAAVCGWFDEQRRRP
jgi:hypothetical protein